MKTRILTLVALILTSGAFAQDNKYGETEDEQIKCKEALSVYRTYRDQKQYDDAYIHWKKACDECPPVVTERLWSDGAKFLKKEIKKAKDSEREAIVVDSLMWAYDMRMEHFPSTSKKPNNRCDILGKKATDFLRYRKDEYPVAYEWYKEAVACLKETSKASYISNYYQLKFNLFATEKDEVKKGALKEELLIEYLTLVKYCEAGAAAATDDKAKEGYTQAKDNLLKYFIKVADDCTVLEEILQAYVDGAPDDLSRKEDAMTLMNARDCTGSDFYLMVVEAVLAQKPSAEGYYSLAIVKAKRDNFRGALENFEKAAELCTEDCPDKERYMLKAGQTANRVGQSSKAMSYANKILGINSKNADAVMLKGDVISGSQGNCADKMEGRSVYWLATDYYSRAKSMDSSLAEKANKKIGSCKKQYPTQEQVFFQGLGEGSSFTVPCWGESTTVRVRG